MLPLSYGRFFSEYRKALSGYLRSKGWKIADVPSPHERGVTEVPGEFAPDLSLNQVPSKPQPHPHRFGNIPHKGIGATAKKGSEKGSVRLTRHFQKKGSAQVK